MPIKRENSQSTIAYALLRERIVSGEFGADQTLTETELADQLAMSRTPVREAVKRLEDEGLLTRVPRKGLTVTTLDQASITALYAFREILECGAARLAARLADDMEIENMRFILEESRMHKDPIRSNYDFHQALYAASHNPFLVKAINNLIDSTALLGQSTLAHTGRPEKAYKEHLALFNAIEKRNEEEAEASARQHIRQALLARLKQQRTIAANASRLHSTSHKA
jgi:DNA-binding GntR family transcriptional regulator